MSTYEWISLCSRAHSVSSIVKWRLPRWEIKDSHGILILSLLTINNFQWLKNKQKRQRYSFFFFARHSGSPEFESLSYNSGLVVYEYQRERMIGITRSSLATQWIKRQIVVYKVVSQLKKKWDSADKTLGHGHAHMNTWLGSLYPPFNFPPKSPTHVHLSNSSSLLLFPFLYLSSHYSSFFP